VTHPHRKVLVGPGFNPCSRQKKVPAPAIYRPGRRFGEQPEEHRHPDPHRALHLRDGCFGLGKSTLVIETLYKVLSRRLYKYRGKIGKVKDVRDLGGIERAVIMNQQPIGRTRVQTR